jgi:hypothetical protein
MRVFLTDRRGVAKEKMWGVWIFFPYLVGTG